MRLEAGPGNNAFLPLTALTAQEMPLSSSQPSEEYLKWLDRAKPGAVQEKPSDRLEIPEFRSSAMKMKTNLMNFREVSQVLNRDATHMYKYFMKALATSGSLHENYVVLKGKFSRAQLSEVLKNYVEQYVICPVCKRPDTRIVKEGEFHFLICDACGARSPVKRV
jgi:translation initiation factor 2 subunit 2